MINTILLIIILVCFGGIIFLVLRKIIFLSKINLSTTPDEDISEIKKRLLLKKVDRKINKIKENIVTRILFFKKYIKKVYVFFQKIYLISKYIFKKLANLDFFKKLVKMIKTKVLK